MKAPMLSELGMDWLVEVTSERYYGPTTLGAINEFVRLGEVTPENFVINTCDGSRRKIQEITPYFPNQVEEGDGSVDQTPAATGMSIEFEERVRDLERCLGEERRALQDAEPRFPSSCPCVFRWLDRVSLPNKPQTPAGSMSGVSSKLCSHRRAYFPPSISNCSWVPRSMMRP